MPSPPSSARGGVLSRFLSSAARLSTRGRALAAGGGAAASTWESVNALAAMPGMINMGQGFPDFPGSRVAREAAAAAVSEGSVAHNQYSPQPGLLSLRQAVSDFVFRRYNRRYDAQTEVAITAGGQEALAAAFFTFLEPGDEVVIFEPCYPFMLGAILQAGGVPRVVKLEAPGFGIDEGALTAACASPRAKMLVLNSPQNPTGHVASAAELRLVADVCAAHDLLAVSDEVYEHCVFPTSSGCAPRHRPLASQPGMRERTITIGSGGKLFALTGWRVAWAYGPAELVQPLSRSHTHLTFSSPTPLQHGIAAALDADDGLAEVGPLFGGNWQMLAEALRHGTPVGGVCEAAGGYFLVAQTDGRSDVDFCRTVAAERGVVCTPMSVFYSGEPADGDEPCTLVRFTVCKSRAYVERACEALRGGRR